MNILHIHWSGRPTIGGIERHLDALNIELNKGGYNSILLCGDRGNSKYQIGFNGLRYSKELNIDLFYDENRDYIEKADLIHMHNGHVICPENGIRLFELFKKGKKKVILSIHNTDESTFTIQGEATFSESQ